MCAVAWNFDRLGPNTPADGDAVRGNFIRESKSAAAIFVRELLQNTLDARVKDAGGKEKMIRIDWSRIMCPDSLVCPKEIKNEK